MKKAISLLVAVAMLACVNPLAFAASSNAVDAAEKLHALGLFSGTGTDENGDPIFDLDRTPTRNEAIVMLVRLLGQEKHADSYRNIVLDFTDVSEWARPYIAYAYVMGYAKGTSPKIFDGNAKTTSSQFLSFVLSSLGYTNGVDFQWDSAWELSDKIKGTSPKIFDGNAKTTSSQFLSFVLSSLGYTNGVDFQWDSAWELSDKIGLTSGEYHAGNKIFSRGDAAQISLKALSIPIKGTDKTLADVLIGNKAISEKQYDIIMNNDTSAATEEHTILSSEYSFVRIDGTLYQIIYSHQMRYPKSNIIYYDSDSPSTVYLDSNATNDMWKNSITLSLLTKSYKTATSDNPFVDRAIDMFSTYYDSSTIEITAQKHYTSATSGYETYHHSYRGKTLDIPREIVGKTYNTMRTINGIRYCGKYINLEDYCKFFSLPASVSVEFDDDLKQDVLVVNYRINLEDYCKFFSLPASVSVEFDDDLKQDVLVVNYR